ncbi:MAG: hypothetical protein HC889_20505 [Synechococcaceae cyanobacterium SM1_2_3]|nr:hypothetical protein [Synechococcaceae cyanobacterium SM1_2_3]
MSNTTCDTETDGVEFLDEFTLLDSHDGSGGSDKTLANVTIAKDDTNDRATLVADCPTWTSLVAGTRDIAGVLIYKFDSDDTDSRPICFLPITIKPDGSDVMIRFDGQETSGLIVSLNDA